MGGCGIHGPVVAYGCNSCDKFIRGLFQDEQSEEYKDLKKQIEQLQTQVNELVVYIEDLKNSTWGSK